MPISTTQRRDTSSLSISSLQSPVPLSHDMPPQICIETRAPLRHFFCRTVFINDDYGALPSRGLLSGERRGRRRHLTSLTRNAEMSSKPARSSLTGTPLPRRAMERTLSRRKCQHQLILNLKTFSKLMPFPMASTVQPATSNPLLVRFINYR